MAARSVSRWRSWGKCACSGSLWPTIDATPRSIPYETKSISLKEDEQKQPWFLEINPNGRIPALTDSFEDGKTIRLFESGSIMQYLVATYDTDHKISFPAGSREFYEMNNWLFFQNAGLGPMQGQANHFNRYAPEKIQYGINRYLNETRRLYRVLEKHLVDTKQDYLVGNKCSKSVNCEPFNYDCSHIKAIADIANWSWVVSGPWAGVDLVEFPVLSKWVDRMWARPGVDKGQANPSPIDKEIMKDPKKIEEKAKEASAWVMKGMKQDAQK